MSTQNQESIESTGSNIFSDPGCRAVLQKLILQLAFDGIKVCLEGLGILFVQQTQSSSTYANTKETILRKETQLELCFEKSYEITNFHYQKFGSIFETSELALRLISRLPENSTCPVKLNLKTLSHDLKKIFSEIRAEILRTGISRQLDKIGTFIALKLNPALNWRDKFGQADFIFIAGVKKTTHQEKDYRYETPLLKSAWEPLEAFYEKLEKQKLNLLETVKSIDINQQDFKDQDLNQECKVAIFKMPSEMEDEISLLYCTSGLKHGELSLQTKVARDIKVPEWPLKLIALVWLLQTINQKNFSVSDLINFDWSVLPEKNNLHGVLLTACKALPGTYFSLQGQINYLNVLGITAKESEFAYQHGPKTLLALLRAKEHHQISKLNRREIF